MPTAADVRNSKRTKESPFGRPMEDETVTILIPEGAESGKIPADDQYIGRCLGFVKELSQSSGNPMLTWVFQIEEGEFAGMDFTLWTPLVDTTMWKVMDTLTALGIPWKPGTPLDLNPKQVKNILVRMRIVDDNFQGRDRSKLQAVLPHPDGAGTKAAGPGFKVPKKAAEEEEEEEQPRRGRPRSTRDDEEEEEQPRRGRPRASREDEEEEDERPARRSGKGWFGQNDDEEEERPARKSRSRDEDEEEEEDERPTRKSTKTLKRSRL
jgi:hypothetical protein